MSPDGRPKLSYDHGWGDGTLLTTPTDQFFEMVVFLSRPGMGELASLTHLNSVKFHTGTDELASLTLFNSVKFRGHL